MYYVSYYSRPRAHIGMSEEDVQHNYNNHHNKIITKRIIEDANYNTSIQYCDATLIQKWITKINNIVRPITLMTQGNEEELWNMYHTFRIPKHNGGHRTIEAPGEQLKLAQQQLLKLFTKDMKVLSHNAAHGFTKGRNCKTALEAHKKNESNWFVKMDIKDFFPSCTELRIKTALDTTYPFCLLPYSAVSKILWLCTKNSRLVQGAPTSPFLANMCMLDADFKLYMRCKEQNEIYTRYADDILISSRKEISKTVTERRVELYLPNSMQLNKDKTRYGSCSGRNWNLGLMYNEGHNITVGHVKKKEVKHAVHNFETKEEMQTREEKYRLLGLVGYCKYIEPEYFQPYLDRVQAVEL